MADRLLPPPIARDASQRAIARLSERISALDLSHLFVYLIDITDAHLLPLLAEQFHVLGDEGWNLANTDAKRRALIKSAIQLHRYKGTAWAVKEVFRLLNVGAELKEWWELTPCGEPYTFELTLWVNDNLEPGQPMLSAGLYERLRRMVNSVKPARSAYQMRVGTRFNQPLALANAARAAQLARHSETPLAVQPHGATQTLALANTTTMRALHCSSLEATPPVAQLAGGVTIASVASARMLVRRTMEILQ